jgi:2Fe-2S ferredoxin
MINVYFIRNGSKIRVEVPEGNTLMQAAKHYSTVPIREIPADCYGCCACGTCHVYIDKIWYDKIEPMSETMAEQTLLDYDKQYKEGESRLSCQVVLKKEHDGMIVHLIDNDSKGIK